VQWAARVRAASAHFLMPRSANNLKPRPQAKGGKEAAGKDGAFASLPPCPGGTAAASLFVASTNHLLGKAREHLPPYQVFKC